MDAKRLGEDPILKTSRVWPVELAQTKLEASDCREKFLHKTDAFNEWSRVEWTLKLGKEVEPTIWDTVSRAFKRNEDNERKGEKAVFDVRVELVDYFFQCFILFR